MITGRATFSACQNLVNHLDRATNAIFVGEPAGSRPNFTGEDTWVELPWSKLRVSISARYWQDSYPTDERPYVPVAMPVADDVGRLEGGARSGDGGAGRVPRRDAERATISRNAAGRGASKAAERRLPCPLESSP